MIATEKDNLMRDASSKALINTDTSLFRQRQAAKQRDLRIKKLESEVEFLTMELREIRESIASIVQRD